MHQQFYNKFLVFWTHSSSKCTVGENFLRCLQFKNLESTTNPWFKPHLTYINGIRTYKEATKLVIAPSLAPESTQYQQNLLKIITPLKAQSTKSVHERTRVECKEDTNLSCSSKRAKT